MSNLAHHRNPPDTVARNGTGGVLVRVPSLLLSHYFVLTFPGREPNPAEAADLFAAATQIGREQALARLGNPDAFTLIYSGHAERLMVDEGLEHAALALAAARGWSLDITGAWSQLTRYAPVALQDYRPGASPARVAGGVQELAVAASICLGAERWKSARLNAADIAGGAQRALQEFRAATGLRDLYTWANSVLDGGEPPSDEDLVADPESLFSPAFEEARQQVLQRIGSPRHLAPDEAAGGILLAGGGVRILTRSLRSQLVEALTYSEPAIAATDDEFIL